MPNATALVTSIDAPLGIVSGENRLFAWLASDSAGQPGAILESFVLQGLVTPPGPIPLLTIDSQVNPLVEAGQRYWFMVTGGAETFGLWSLNVFQGNPADGGATRTVIGGMQGPWSVGSGPRTGALQISGGNPVPEPSTALLVKGALIGLVLFRRRSARPL